MLKIALTSLCAIAINMNVVCQNSSVMTYNIRLDIPIDGENAWPNRKEFLVSQLKFYSPDIFGVQEALPHQVDFINRELSDYHFIGKGRDGSDKGEYSAIFYKSDIFKMELQKTFWLSLTPKKVSKGWDAAYTRICTYGLFTHRLTNKKIWIFNTHLDNIGVLARKNSIDLILEQIQKENKMNYPVIFMGDFNVEPEDNLITSLKRNMKDTKNVSIDKPFGPTGTFNSFEFTEPVAKRIDYIFISKSNKLKVKKYAVLSDSKNLKYPSDHFPVYVELIIN